MTTTMQYFGAQSHSLRPHYPQLDTPPCGLTSRLGVHGVEMHLGSLLTCRPRFSQVGLEMRLQVRIPHPLGNVDQFQRFV